MLTKKKNLFFKGICLFLLLGFIYSNSETLEKEEVEIICKLTGTIGYKVNTKILKIQIFYNFILAFSFIK